MDIKDILALAHAGFTAEQINAMSTQQTQPTPRPEIRPQVQPQMVQPQMVQVNPYGVPFIGQLTPAPMPPVPANNPTVADKATEAAPNVPGNPSPEQLAGQLAQAQATNLNGVVVSPAQKVSIEEKLQDHYRALMGVSEDNKKGE